MAAHPQDIDFPLARAGLSDLSRSERYLIGVSGGRDSVALLHWLTRNGYRRLIVCHLNHQLRGRAAAADARFVERLAEEHALECESGATDVRAFAKEKKLSLETAARGARYAFFVQVARRRRCARLFLAHHADDLVETFLLNLFRGAGLSGLSALRPASTHRIGRTELLVLRPLLGVWRSEIDSYVRTHGLTFREDASNQTLDPLRNRLRHVIIALLEKELGRAIGQTIWRTATIAAEEDAFMQSQVPPVSDKLSVGSLVDQPPALQRRAIRNWLRHHGASDISFDLIKRVASLLDPSAGPAKVNLPGERHARRRAGELFIE